MKPENAIIAFGRGRPWPRPTASDITAPCEKPPSTTLSCGRSSTKPAAAANPSANVGGAGGPSRGAAAQRAAPGGNGGGPRGEEPARGRAGAGPAGHGPRRGAPA